MLAREHKSTLAYEYAYEYTDRDGCWKKQARSCDRRIKFALAPAADSRRYRDTELLDDFPRCVILQGRDFRRAWRPLSTFGTTRARARPFLPAGVVVSAVYFRVACPETLSQVSQTCITPGTFAAVELYVGRQARANAPITSIDFAGDLSAR